MTDINRNPSLESADDLDDDDDVDDYEVCRCRVNLTATSDSGQTPWTGPQMGSVWSPGAYPRPPRQPRTARPLVLQLLSRRTFIFDGRANGVESVPLPEFPTEAYGSWVLSVAVAQKTSFLVGNQLKIWVQNVAVDEDNPSVTFVGDGPAVTISSSPAAPHLATSDAKSTIGPEARLLVQWTQGLFPFNPPIAAVASVVVSAYLTLRPKTKPPVT